MDRTSISRRIGSIKGDIEKLSNTLCAIEKTDIENYPDNYAMLTTDAALRSELIACRMRHLLYGSTATRKETYLASAGVVQGIRIKAQENMLEITQIPPTTTVEAIMDKIAELVKAGKIKEISDMRDEGIA